MENRVGEPIRAPAAAQDHAPGPQPNPPYSDTPDGTSDRDATRPGTPRVGTSTLGPSPAGTSPADTAVPPLDLAVHRPRSGGVLVVLRGALVAATAPGLARTLAELAPRIALDLSGVTSIAPECLDVLLRTEESLAAVGGSLVLLAPSPAVVLMLHEIA